MFVGGVESGSMVMSSMLALYLLGGREVGRGPVSSAFLMFGQL